MDGIEPSESIPLNIGGIAGVDPIQFIKDIYDLTYGGDQAVRYDSAQFTALLGHPLIPKMWFRFTKPMEMSGVVHDIYRALLLVPFMNVEGEVDPQLMRLLQDIDPVTLTTIGPSEAVTSPTWDHSTRDLVTAVRFNYEWGYRLDDSRLLIPDVGDWPADRYRAEQRVEEFTHDNIADLGRHEITIPLTGLRGPHEVLRHGRALSTDIFDRYGDGPIEGHVDTLSSIDEPNGTWVVFSGLPIPNPQTNARGDARLVQIMDREVQPVGFRYRYLDGGRKLAVLLPPIVAIGPNAARPKHAVDVTISALPTGTKYDLQVKIGSDDWTFYRDGSTNETVVVQDLPANTTIQARARTTSPNRVRSAWSSAVSQATTALTAASALATSVSGRTIALSWTNGEADEEIMVTLDGVDYLNVNLEAGTTRFVFTELAASTLFTLGVKHVDPYGGASTLVTAQDTTGTAGALSVPRALAIVQGAPASDVVYPAEVAFGAGIEISWTRTEPHAAVEVQVDDNSGFTSPSVSRAGGQNRLRVDLPLNDTLQYFRVRHGNVLFISFPMGYTVASRVPEIAGLATLRTRTTLPSGPSWRPPECR